MFVQQKQNIYNENNKSPKRTVTSLSWSLVDTSKVAAGLETSQRYAVYINVTQFFHFLFNSIMDSVPKAL
jgi:hypothetical protein